MNRKITKAALRAMLPGEVIMQVCNDAAELEAAFQTATQVKKEDPIGNYKISRGVTTCTVVVRRTNPTTATVR